MERTCIALRAEAYGMTRPNWKLASHAQRFNFEVH